MTCLANGLDIVVLQTKVKLEVRSPPRPEAADFGLRTGFRNTPIRPHIFRNSQRKGISTTLGQKYSATVERFNYTTRTHKREYLAETHAGRGWNAQEEQGTKERACRPSTGSCQNTLSTPPRWRLPSALLALYSHHLLQSVRFQHPSPSPFHTRSPSMEPVFLQHYDQIEIDDDEEDQLLDSDPEDELPAPTSIPPPPPPPPPPVARDTGKDIDPDVDAAVPRYSRKKGETIFPPLRIENILRADGETGIMSREALLVLSLATEEFITRMVDAAVIHANDEDRQRTVITYKDIAHVANSPKRWPELEFLGELMPKPMTVTKAFQNRALKEQELIAEDPALTQLTSPLPPPDPSLPTIPLSVLARPAHHNHAHAHAQAHPPPHHQGHPEAGRASTSDSHPSGSGTPLPDAADKSKGRSKSGANGKGKEKAGAYIPALPGTLTPEQREQAEAKRRERTIEREKKRALSMSMQQRPRTVSDASMSAHAMGADVDMSMMSGSASASPSRRSTRKRDSRGRFSNSGANNASPSHLDRENAGSVTPDAPNHNYHHHDHNHNHDHSHHHNHSHDGASAGPSNGYSASAPSHSPYTQVPLVQGWTEPGHRHESGAGASASHHSARSQSPLNGLERDMSDIVMNDEPMNAADLSPPPQTLYGPGVAPPPSISASDSRGRSMSSGGEGPFGAQGRTIYSAR
ncbi:uncharacterized protein STEHIDRAFT_168871 [Stereum hirsutum FP-91666 SS1]|uniref:uncharacterized protein n=1 Tax=Stereum hirsutum (strain FP-91666) TaxID=721885 RepID=UPI000444A27E|nr:uncharacterized protein STEHIDRAFT_168871 [Stereum hirsutum FP-91666 SS1]EIM85797.1 hypothetical protein STEHIDRAFT_168871 [Stereum hirsutum FP-91666 SS1]